MYRIIGLLLLCIFSINVAVAQDNHTPVKGKVGLSASVQNTQFDILVPIWVSDKTVMGPSFSFISVQDSGSDLGIGGFSRFYFQTEEIAPYFGMRAGAVFGIPGEGDTVVDIITGLAFGGEYFIDEQFSLGIEIQGNFTFSDEGSSRFGNPGGINFNTASLITASIYF